MLGSAAAADQRVPDQGSLNGDDLRVPPTNGQALSSSALSRRYSMGVMPTQRLNAR